MAGNVLGDLVTHARKAVAGGTYDVDADLAGSATDLAGTIRANPHPTLITEVKFASPSLGRIREDADPAQVAGQMVAGGAKALSVLTQPYKFSGSPEYFMRVRESTGVPMLMKDIMVDTAQIDAAARIGADYILVIQSLYERGFLSGIDGFIGYGHGLGLKVLLEVHTEQEMEAALGTEADMIGINNRNLDTLEVDLGTTERILANTPWRDGAGGRPVISESGISSPEEIRRLRQCGADGFLVGSSIMGDDDVAGRVRRLAEAY